MPDVDVLEEVMRIHHAAPWPPSAAEVLMAVSECFARSSTTAQPIDHAEVLRDGNADQQGEQGQRHHQLDQREATHPGAWLGR